MFVHSTPPGTVQDIDYLIIYSKQELEQKLSQYYFCNNTFICVMQFLEINVHLLIRANYDEVLESP